MDFLTLLVDAVKTSVCHSITTRDVVAVVGELFARCETRSFADDFIALDYELTAVGMRHHPFSSQQRDRAIGTIFDRNEVNERVRFVRRKGWPAVVVGELVEAGG